MVEYIQHEIIEKPIAVYNFEVLDNHNYYVAESVFANLEQFVLVHNKCKATNKLQPDKNAGGAHSTFSRDPKTGKISKYATWETNIKNPNGFQEVIRYDGLGSAHNGIPTPHIHDKLLPGSVRPAFPWEIPLFK